MKKLINAVENVLSESLDGFAAAHADIVELGTDRLFVRRKKLRPGKVALLSGGGSGHEPLHAGFVGRGMLDDPHWGWHAARALGADVKRPNQYARTAPKVWSGPRA